MDAQVSLQTNNLISFGQVKPLTFNRFRISTYSRQIAAFLSALDLTSVHWHPIPWNASRFTVAKLLFHKKI